MLKRTFDFFVSAISLIVLFPLFFALILLIKFDSDGPAVFRQKRAGKGGRLFTLYKFRTMENKKRDLAEITRKGDKRITRIGKILRKTNLDELPQLFNVFMGDMSLVGPRPEVPSMMQFYPDKWAEVLKVRPGLTGLAQVEYGDKDINNSNIGDIEKFYIDVVLPKKLDLDLKYAKKLSFLLDINILYKTLFKML